MLFEDFDMACMLDQLEQMTSDTDRCLQVIKQSDNWVLRFKDDTGCWHNLAGWNFDGVSKGQQATGFLQQAIIKFFHTCITDHKYPVPTDK